MSLVTKTIKLNDLFNLIRTVFKNTDPQISSLNDEDDVIPIGVWGVVEGDRMDYENSNISISNFLDSVNASYFSDKYMAKTKDVYFKQLVASTGSTSWADKLTQLDAQYTALSSGNKMRTQIRRGNTSSGTIHKYMGNGIYTYVAHSSSKLFVRILDMKNKKAYEANNNLAFSDVSASTSSTQLALDLLTIQ